MSLPKNTPETIYLDLGTECNDFNDLTDVTWSKDNATGKGVEYIRKDIAEQKAKELAKIYANELVSGFTILNIDEFSPSI